MTRLAQLSLFGANNGKGLLFAAGTLRQYFEERRTVAIPSLEAKATAIHEWLDSLRSTTATEATLEAQFFQKIMVGVLGYSLFPEAGTTTSLYPKPPSKLTRIARTPDALLGAFSRDDAIITVALELKTPGTNLDLPQARELSETPVEQGFYYGRRILGVRWVIVSDMRLIRLYSVQSQDEFEEIDLRECVTDQGAPTEKLRVLHQLLHHESLVLGDESAPVSALFKKTTENQLEIRSSFYGVYYSIRSDLYAAVCTATATLSPAPTPADLLAATQRLLDRILFLNYCEDNPSRLIPERTVEGVTNAARKMPGPSTNKVYESLKQLFKEVDAGSPPGSGIKVYGYNGELFKQHWILDHIDLPDSLHDKRYTVTQQGGPSRTVQGAWGLHAFDFWAELNEHLLGHVFEESLSDLGVLGSGGAELAAAKIDERKRKGIYYTSSILSDFLCNSALRGMLDERAPIDAADDLLVESLLARLSALLDLKVLDPACGSGAFLVSAFREIQTEYWRIHALLETAKGAPGRKGARDGAAHDQAHLLRNSLFGVDLLPQAVEIAKLALWLRSARANEKVADLGDNIVSGNSLDVTQFFSLLRAEPASFDLVVGNPPWGGDVDAQTYTEASKILGITEPNCDSWELFVLLGLRALRDGGRLAFVLPDSFLYSEKARLRTRLLASAAIEKLYNLGPDWFGKSVRMGTIVL